MTLRAPRSARCSRSRAACWSRSACPSSSSPGGSSWSSQASCSVSCRSPRRCISGRSRTMSPHPSWARGRVVLLSAAVAIGWFGWRPLFRLAETSFWSLNALLIQPGYAACREVLRHFSERLLPATLTDASRGKLRAGAAAVAGVLLFSLGLLVVGWAWPRAHLFATLAEVNSFTRFAKVTLANSLLVVAGYLAVAALFWGFADALMPQPITLHEFSTRTKKRRRLACRPSLRHPYRRRALWLPARERASWPARQCPPQAPPRRARRDPRQSAGRCRPHQRRRHGCGYRRRMGRVLRHDRALSEARAADADPSRQSRHQYRRPLQPCAHGSARQSQYPAAAAQDAVSDGRGPGQAGQDHRPQDAQARQEPR